MFTPILTAIQNIAESKKLFGVARKKGHLIGFALVLSSLSTYGAPGFQPEFQGNRIGMPDWLSVYTHLPELVKLSVELEERQAFPVAATVELVDQAPQDIAGKATYFRSRPIQVDSDNFSVEWHENIMPDVGGPQFELWGEVGKRPNEVGRLLIRLSRNASGLVPNPGNLIPLESGWHHFKVVVSSEKNAFDLYCDDMENPIFTALPLLEGIESTERLGIGFIWYLAPQTLPTRWQIGGISLLPL